MDMIRVSGGDFLMGSDLGDSADRPAHPVSVKDFLISRFPLRQSEWKAIHGHNPSYFKGDSLPVEQITWLDAIAFCNALSEQEGLVPCYRYGEGEIFCDFAASGYRLPTEAEWEYAARGGKESRGFLYPGSDNLDDVAWYMGNAKNVTHPVGKKKPNELGLHDMAGNVYEWCWDWYEPYQEILDRQSEPRIEELHGGEKRRRVIRGGNCQGPSYRLRSSARWSGHPECGYDLVGLRLARSADPQRSR